MMKKKMRKYGEMKSLSFDANAPPPPPSFSSSSSLSLSLSSSTSSFSRRAALHYAAQRGNVDIMELLLSRGADPNMTDIQGYCCLHIASAEGQVDVVRFLLSRRLTQSCVMAKDGCTPLHLACANGHGEVVKLLLSHGADPLLITMEGYSCVDTARLYRHFSIALLLQEWIDRRNLLNNAAFCRLPQSLTRSLYLPNETTTPSTPIANNSSSPHHSHSHSHSHPYPYPPHSHPHQQHQHPHPHHHHHQHSLDTSSLPAVELRQRLFNTLHRSNRPHVTWSTHTLAPMGHQPTSPTYRPTSSLMLPWSSSGMQPTLSSSLPFDEQQINSPQMSHFNRRTSCTFQWGSSGCENSTSSSPSSSSTSPRAIASSSSQQKAASASCTPKCTRLMIDDATLKPSRNSADELKQNLKDGCFAVQARAIGTFSKGHMSFVEGDLITVLRQQDVNWWKGYVTSQGIAMTGLFPACLVQLVDPSRPPLIGTSGSPSLDYTITGSTPTIYAFSEDEDGFPDAVDDESKNKLKTMKPTSGGGTIGGEGLEGGAAGDDGIEGINKSVLGGSAAAAAAVVVGGESSKNKSCGHESCQCCCHSPGGGSRMETKLATAVNNNKVIASPTSPASVHRHSGASWDSGRGSAYALTLDGPTTTTDSSNKQSTSSSGAGTTATPTTTPMSHPIPVDNDVYSLLHLLRTINLSHHSRRIVDAGYDLYSLSRATPEDLTSLGITSPQDRIQLKVLFHQMNLIIPDPLPRSLSIDLDTVLSSLQLCEYQQVLHNQGFRTSIDLTALSWEDLADIGVKKLGHLKKFMLLIDRLKKMKNLIENQRSSSTNDLFLLKRSDVIQGMTNLSADPHARLQGNYVGPCGSANMLNMINKLEKLEKKLDFELTASLRRQNK